LNRRDLLVFAAGAAAWPLAVSAQQPGKVYRIAMVHPALPAEGMTGAANPPSYGSFFDELRDRGYVEGQNLAVGRYSGIGVAHPNELILSVAAAKPDAMFVVAFDGPVRDTPVAVPIIHIGLDPLAIGLTTSLAHPDRNITGVAVTAGSALYTKHFELLREAFPVAARIALLTSREMWDGNARTNIFGPLQEAGTAMGVTLLPAIAEPPYGEAEYRAAFAATATDRPAAMIVSQAIRNYGQLKLIVELAASARLPAIYPQRNFVDQGGLMSYGSVVAEAYRRAANDVAQIFGGAKPSDIPFYQATRFELVINLKTAKALGMTVPQSIFARAEEVIE
jgi:putative tryptophan/tyrosine transport system substrate-binding protein